MSKEIPAPQLPAARAPRRNTFAQAAAPAQREAEAATPLVAPPAQSVNTPEVEVGAKERSKRMEGTKDILLSMPSSQKERMEATIAHTQAYTGVKHQQVFIRTAVERLCEQLERQYNNGQRYTLPPTAPSL
nr:hypothetical protein [uncultured Rhodococcus sp.]